MASAVLLNRLRRCISRTSLSQARQFHILSVPNPKSAAFVNSLLRQFPARAPADAISLAGALGSFGLRSIFTRSQDDSEFSESRGFDFIPDTEFAALATDSEVLHLGSASGGGDSILPVRAVISTLDGIHEFTGLPWWIVIAGSTLALRAALFPLLLYQLHKLKLIDELSHKLPRPLPPLFSGKSYIDHISLFREKRKEIGCPSYLWHISYFSVQVPCFFLLLTSIRRMSLDHHPGFDSGGALWFQNLTEFSQGASGAIFPLVIAGLHYAMVQISFQTLPASKGNGIIDLKHFKTCMDLFTLAIFFICFYVPQGSLVYWVTNSSLGVMQKLSLKNPFVRAMLGLPEINKSLGVGSSDTETLSITPPSEIEKKKISVENLSPNELTSLSVQLLSEKQIGTAIQMLHLALSKDPECAKALILMGQAKLQAGLLDEAIENMEHAVSKLMCSGYPTELEDIDNLILASLWAGSAYSRQGKPEEGLVHLERIGELKEPEDPKVKAHYFDGLLMLSSALYNAGRKEEAVKHLRLLAVYNPAYSEFLEQCEKDGNSEVASSTKQDFLP